MADDLVSWCAALVALIKIVQMMTFNFYGKVRFGQLVFCTGEKGETGFSDSVVTCDIKVDLRSPLNELSYIPKVKVIYLPWSWILLTSPIHS